MDDPEIAIVFSASRYTPPDLYLTALYIDAPDPTGPAAPPNILSTFDSSAPGALEI